jgi:hypothetical protein
LFQRERERERERERDMARRMRKLRKEHVKGEIKDRGPA